MSDLHRGHYANGANLERTVRPGTSEGNGERHRAANIYKGTSSRGSELEQRCNLQLFLLQDIPAPACTAGYIVRAGKPAGGSDGFIFITADLQAEKFSGDSS